MFEDVRYEVKRLVAWATGKSARVAATGAVNSMTSAEGAAANSLNGISLTVSGLLGAGVNVLLAQMDFRKDRQKIVDFYRTEIAATLHKDERLVGISDLPKVASRNKVIGDAYERSSLSRWLKIGVGVAVGIGAMLAVATLFAPAGVIGLAMVGSSAGAVLAAKLAVGTAIGFVGGSLLGYAAEKVTGLREPSAHNQICQMQKRLRGRGTVSLEQVMEVCITANKGLSEHVEKTFGAPFGALDNEKQRAIIAEYGPRFHLEQLTQDLNNRQVRVGELAFAAAGQASGVARIPDPPQTFKQRAREYAGHAFNHTKTAANHAYSAGQHVIHSGRDQYGKLKTYICGPMENGEVKCAVLDEEKSKQHLAMVDALHNKWQKLVTRRPEESGLARG